MVKCLPRTLPIESFNQSREIEKLGNQKVNFGFRMRVFKKIKLLYLILAVAIPFLVIFISSFFFLGAFLSPQDKLEKAQVIVVISGGETLERTSEGVELFKQGYAPYVLFSGAAKSGNVSNAKSMKRYALKQGVLEDKILIEEKATSTYENALFTKEILDKLDFKKIILVTSPYHQRRAYMNFSYVLGKDYKIINHSSNDSSWQEQNWWKSKKNTNTTITEFFRIIYLGATGNYNVKND